ARRRRSQVSGRLTMPTSGIGAGAGTAGQVLVLSDVLGLYDRFTPKFAKRYAELGQAMTRAAAEYRSDVESRAFPGREHTYAMPEADRQSFLASEATPRRLAKLPPWP